MLTILLCKRDIFRRHGSRIRGGAEEVFAIEDTDLYDLFPTFMMGVLFSYGLLGPGLHFSSHSKVSGSDDQICGTHLRQSIRRIWYKSDRVLHAQEREPI